MNSDMIITNAPDGSMVRRAMTKTEKKRFDEKAKRAQLKAAPERAGAVEENSLSPARRRLKKLQGDTVQNKVVAVEIAGEEYFIRSLDFPELTRLGLLTPRDKNGLLDMSKAENLGALTSAMLFCCIAVDAEDTGDYFGSLEEANEWVSSSAPNTRSTVGALFNKCLERTPDILPGALPDATPEQQEAHEKKGESGTKGEPVS